MHAVIDTDKGAIQIEFFAADAPNAVENFRLLAEHGYYDGLTFHRIVKGFMIQGGDPAGDGTGGSSDNGWTQHKGQQQRGDRGAGCAEADVVEEIENDVLLAKRGEPVIEHQSSTGTERCRGCTGFFARAASAGIIRSNATPRDALSTTTSSPRS